MRAVSGSVVSSEPISIRRAAAILSKFAKADAGAPVEVAAYVRRASKAFDDLSLFHREIGGSIQNKSSSQIQNLGVGSERGDNDGGIHVIGEDWDRKMKKKLMKVTKADVAEGNPSIRTHERDAGRKNLGVESERGENGGGVHVIGDDGDRKMKKMRKKDKVKGVHERNDEGRKRNREAMEVRSDSGDRNEPHKQKKKRRRMEAEH